MRVHPRRAKAPATHGNPFPFEAKNAGRWSAATFGGGHALGSRVQGLGVRGWFSGFRDWGLGFRGLGFRG